MTKAAHDRLLKLALACGAALGCAALLGSAAPPALAGSATKVVSYHDYRLRVPASWPVYHVSADSKTCVRFNRHAVYLGAPGADQQCPAQLAGRTEAILVQPLQHAGSAAISSPGAARPLPEATLAAADVPAGSSARLIDRADGVVVTATWRQDRAVIRRALGVRSLAALAADSIVRPKAAAVAKLRVSSTTGVRAAATAAAGSSTAAAATPGAVYKGLGFDACSTPSTSVMSDWGASPFRAIGVYIGGANMACSQPNLTASWVTGESEAGWHLIPIYVGLQAPSNSCGCAAISASSAASEGDAAAKDAVAQAQAVGIGVGNPIYFDMEAYSRTSANTSTVLIFLAAWTTTLHADGYRSGVYSSADSGIADLVSEYGSTYAEPDDLWFADWNGEEDVTDSVLPAADWSDGQRLHQYEGAYNATYDGKTINIDGDYLDGATAAAGSAGAVVASAPPAATGHPSVTGTPVSGQTLTEHHAPWSGDPDDYSYQWQRCSASGDDCKSIVGATGTKLKLTSAETGDRIRVVEDATNAAGAGTKVDSPVTVTVRATPAGYWLYTAAGDVYDSLYEPLHGSPASLDEKAGAITGMAAPTSGGGYWLVTSEGTVYAYGDAESHPALRTRNPVEGIVAAPNGGYWLYTAKGNVYNSKGTAWYGSAAKRDVSTVVGMAASSTGKGYWLVTSNGTVYAYGDAKKFPAVDASTPIEGIVASPDGGYWLYTADGDVYASKGTLSYGSPAGGQAQAGSVTGMVGSPNGKGYWLVTSTGRVYGYGNADASYPALSPSGAVIGISGR